MNIKISDSRAGIYVIKNCINNKVYVGKSNNIYKRLHQHKTDVKYTNRNYNENPHLLNSILKHGWKNFEYFVIEYINEDENLEKNLSEKELYWILKLNALDKNIGYNLRLDSKTKCICSEETKLKISNRLKKEWANGSRNGHSEKMKLNWKNNKKRSKQQSELFSKIKTKYYYEVYKNDQLLETCEYKRLNELGLAASCFSHFHRFKEDNEHICKGFLVKRLIK